MHSASRVMFHNTWSWFYLLKVNFGSADDKRRWNTCMYIDGQWNSVEASNCFVKLCAFPIPWRKAVQSIKLGMVVKDYLLILSFVIRVQAAKLNWCRQWLKRLVQIQTNWVIYVFGISDKRHCMNIYFILQILIIL